MTLRASLALALALVACTPEPKISAASVAPSAAPPAAVRGLTPDEPFRAGPPPSQASAPWVPGPVRETRLPNGMRLLVFERHATPVVAAQLVARGGLAAFPSEPVEPLVIACDSATRGAGSRTEWQILGTFDALFAEINIPLTQDAVTIRIRAMATAFDEVLALLRDVAVEPAFPASMVDLSRQRSLGSLQVMDEGTWHLGRTLMYGAAYGSAHPYPHGMQTTGEGLAKVTREDVVRAWKRAVDPADATLVVAGDVDPAKLAVRVETLFGGWKHNPARPPLKPLPPPSPSPNRLVVVDAPGAPLATVLFGSTTRPPSAHIDVASKVVSQLLGGMQSSQLAQRLRVELGATANGGVFLQPGRGEGILFWQGSVDRDKTAIALRAVDRRLRELRDVGPSSVELEDAKGRLARGVPHAFETVGGIADELAGIALRGQPVDELQTYESSVRGVTAADVRAALPAPEAMRAVVIGDLGVLREQLVGLGWGVVEERDRTGAVVRTFTR